MTRRSFFRTCLAAAAAMVMPAAKAVYDDGWRLVRTGKATWCWMKFEHRPFHSVYVYKSDFFDSNFTGHRCRVPGQQSNA